MKLNISADARPQVRTLLIAAVLTIALWFIPFAEVLTYPFRLFVTFVHEGGHAIATLLTGNSVLSLSVSPNASGQVQSTQGGFFSQAIVSSAGYVGAMLYGALLLFLIRRAVAARAVLIGSAVFIFFLTLVFGVWKPVVNGLQPGVQISGVPFTLIAGTAIALGLAAVAKFTSPRFATFFLSFLAVQCVLNALLDLKTVFFLSSPFGPEVHSDAANMANATHIPAMFWAVLWIGLSFLILSAAMRFYAVSQKKSAKQPDLPFEEPLEV
jgi:hypothetical protein